MRLISNDWKVQIENENGEWEEKGWVTSDEIDIEKDPMGKVRDLTMRIIDKDLCGFIANKSIRLVGLEIDNNDETANHIYIYIPKTVPSDGKLKAIAPRDTVEIVTEPIPRQ